MILSTFATRLFLVLSPNNLSEYRRRINGGLAWISEKKKNSWEMGVTVTWWNDELAKLPGNCVSTLNKTIIFIFIKTYVI